MIRRLAAYYHTDPGTVMTWSPAQLRLNLDCWLDALEDAADVSIKAAQSPVGLVPVLVVGGMP